MFQAMSACTSITYVNKKLIGDPLDIEMFNFTGWQLEEPEQIEGIENVIQYFYPNNSPKEKF